MTSGHKVIGLFGGTFDPVHNGHVTVSKSYLSSGLIDELWILLTPHPPHKTEQELSPYPVRKQMLRAAFKNIPGIKISDVETHLPSPSYTVQTLQYLRKQYSDHAFYLCIGEDSLNSFKDWYRWKEILTWCDLLVARRPNNHLDQTDEQVLSHVRFVEHKPVEVSSSSIRDKVSRGEDVSGQIPQAVYKLIQENHLYQIN